MARTRAAQAIRLQLHRLSGWSDFKPRPAVGGTGFLLPTMLQFEESNRANEVTALGSQLSTLNTQRSTRSHKAALLGSGSLVRR